MNANTFRLIFSKRLGMCVPVSEQHSAQGKVASEKIAERVLGSLAFSLTLLCATPALALPVAPTVAHGSASFSQSGSTLTVTNTPNAIINWGSFSIGQNELTQFIQQSSASAVLNRVTGQSPSQILGQLQSNGRVFLINPNGIVFGQGARIDTAGLIASTLNLSDADFLTGKLKFSGTGSEAKVDNQGTISTAQGGFVYLIAPHVENSGLINAPNGDVLLAAGHSVEIADGLNPALRVLLTAPEGSVVNLGQVLAESGRIGLHGSMVANSGTVSASSAVVEGGKIYLRATEKIELTETSKLSADGTVGGEITAITQKDGQIAGELVGRGEISAQGNGSVGSGGFVETSAAKVNLNGISVKTRGGTWLIDPTDFTIASGESGGLDGDFAYGDISGATLNTALSSGNVTILSSNGSNTRGSGDINVNDAVSWSANTLTLTAARDININAVMTATGSAGLTMNTSTSNGNDIAVPGGTVRVGGTLTLTGGSYSNNGTLTVTSTGTVNSGGGLTFTQLFTNQGTFNVKSGMTTFANGFTQTAGNLVLGGGNITGNLTLQGGSLKGAGTITGNVNLGAATLTPGSSPGTLNITGNLTLSPTSTTLIELWGTTAGLFDVINVSGIASLAGALNATTGNGYVPSVGHSLRFMTFASKTGSFGSTSLPSGMSLSALATALDLLGPAALPPGVTSSVNQLDNAINLGAITYETPFLYISGQSSPTASSTGTLTQTAEIVLPDLMPQAPSAGESGDDANNASAVAGLTPLFDQLVRDARFKDTPHDSRLICR
ncbi:filamentous hemagglutinin N-terminal domain-containing protein [Rhodoferax sp.]|uniref:two-partner secretion domain-containing protein n=2 Tax=Rhodoferax sp. TaxID=50421 RepID=UPI00273634FC|nr:filamentous hemagglutinin N-terminal domain-containing protein [Rhodoferax sp.]MDP3192060.1 filamentous hemagglutinin N-terminal domain-containing protein [Rhodoferax sp.]MDP3337370.1 filamentous hemagglutinin N-terminal domain-containing protein [Rhodoferax sp.]